MKKKKLILFILAILLAFVLASCGSSKTTIEVTMTGGTGRVSIESPTELHQDGDEFTAVITWSSSHYDRMTVDGQDYEPEIVDGHSVFEIPIVLDEEMTVMAETTAMSQPHDIEYELYFDSSTIKE